MNRLPPVKQAAILKALTEGMSVRATARMVGVSKMTVLRLLVDAGELCAIYSDQVLRNLPCQRIQADEMWSFIGAKQRNAKKAGDGDTWTFIAIDADTKLIVSWLVGQRNARDAEVFMRDVRSRLAHRVQLTTDGHHMYFSAVERAFGWYGTDYAQLVKLYGQAPEGQRRYSPPICLGTVRQWIMGNPVEADVSTSYVERANLSLRMQSRRFTRLTNGFSRKAQNHAAALALHFFVSNFCRPHGTLTKAAGGVHTSPAMAAGLTAYVWKLEDLCAMLEPTYLIGRIAA